MVESTCSIKHYYVYLLTFHCLAQKKKKDMTHVHQERHKGEEKEQKEIDSARHPVAQHFL